MNHEQEITLEQAKQDLQKIVGETVARTWQGYGPVIFLELGTLQKEYYYNKKANEYRMLEIGDWTLSSDGDWCILREGNVLFHSLTSPGDIDEILDQFDGTTILSVELSADATILSVTFSTGTILQMNRDDTSILEDNCFFTLLYNHYPSLSLHKQGKAYYQNNRL